MYDELLASQWGLLRSWLDESGVLSELDAASSLPGWSVGDLVAHLGMVPRALTRVVAAPDEQALSVGEYVSAYAPAADEISAMTQDLAADWAADLLAGIDASWAAGLAALPSIPAGVVRGPRGPIARDDFVLTRVLELVVHSYDLADSLPALAAPPILLAARSAVTDSLTAEYARRTGSAPTYDDADAWIREVTGRRGSADLDLPLL